MTDTQTLESLIDQLEKAEGPDRELDAAIAVALFKSKSGSEWGEYARLPNHYDKCTPGTYWIGSRSGDSLRTSPYYTTYPKDAFAALRAKLSEVQADG